ncbi:MAG TPA: HlyD family efflux transporter periplasmic adaptor subunit [Thermoanaerobaculia bacterium]
MAARFHRTLRVIDADRGRAPRILLGITFVLITAWLLWFALAEVPVLAVTNVGRIETKRAVHAIDAPVDGTVTNVLATVGKEVREGEPLVELNVRAETLLESEERTRRGSATATLQSLHAQLASRRSSLEETRAAGAAAHAERTAKANEAEEVAQLAEGDATRIEKLYRNGLVAEAEVERARTEARRQRAAAVAQLAGAASLRDELKATEATRLAEIEQLRSQIAALEGTIAVSAISSSRLEHDIEQRVIRAPIRGVIAEDFRVRPGAYVEAGTRLSSIVPDGQLIAVGQYAPIDASGRIHVGQHASVRLPHMISTGFLRVTGAVSAVASEPRDGFVRVEVRIDAGKEKQLAHGSPVIVEIETERCSPATLILRSIGKRL